MTDDTSDGDGPEPDAAQRVARVLARMSDEYAAWLVAEGERLDGHVAVMRADPLDPRPAEAIFRVAHDIKGQAATFDHPLAGAVAERLCRLLRDAPVGSVPADLVAAHVAALAVVAVEDLRGSIGPAGAALLDRLDRAAGLDPG
jgi:chemotaxis protein histidine kinase CheA